MNPGPESVSGIDPVPSAAAVLPLFEQPWPDGDFCFFQLGFVVDDLIGAAGQWARVFGVGPFHVMPRSEAACTYHGTTSPIIMQVAVAQAGPVQIELIQQHDATPSIFLDGRNNRRSGLHQLCTITADYDGKKAHYERQGYEVASELRAPGQRIAFIDTVDDFGFFTEVIEGKQTFVSNVEAIARTCAAWDGSDPVRLLTRDGYRTP